MEILQPIQLIRAIDKQTEAANIVELTANMALSEIDGRWWIDENLSLLFMKEGDYHWTWGEIIQHYSNNVLRASVAVQSTDGYLEGAMAYVFNAKSKIEPTKGSVYVGWIATAPRNRGRLVQQPPYKGIGSILLYWAVRESYLTGFEGRITLKSLPSPRTTSFYENRGLIQTGPLDIETNLIDYELPVAAAHAWLKKKGDLS